MAQQSPEISSRFMRLRARGLRSLKSGQAVFQRCDQRLQCHRGQTSIDLVLAVSLFFIGMTVLTVTSPLLFFPSDISVTDERVSADTVANELLTEELAAAGGAGISHEKTTAFATSGDISGVTSATSGQDVFITLSVTDDSDAPPVFNSEGDDSISPGRLVIEAGTEPQGLSTTVERRTTLLTQTVKVTVIVGTDK